MLVDRKKPELAMARACMNSADLPAAAGLPRPTVQNAIVDTLENQQDLK